MGFRSWFFFSWWAINNSWKKLLFLFCFGFFDVGEGAGGGGLRMRMGGWEEDWDGDGDGNGWMREGRGLDLACGGFFWLLWGGEGEGGGREAKGEFFLIGNYFRFTFFFHIMYVKLSFKMRLLWNRHLMPVFHLAARKRFHVNGIRH